MLRVNDELGLLMEDPRGTESNPEEAYLELFPGAVGIELNLGLAQYDDSYGMFVGDDYFFGFSARSLVG